MLLCANVCHLLTNILLRGRPTFSKSDPYQGHFGATLGPLWGHLTGIATHSHGYGRATGETTKASTSTLTPPPCALYLRRMRASVVCIKCRTDPSNGHDTAASRRIGLPFVCVVRLSVSVCKRQATDGSQEEGPHRKALQHFRPSQLYVGRESVS